jgi:hypothetical protein
VAPLLLDLTLELLPVSADLIPIYHSLGPFLLNDEHPGRGERNQRSRQREHEHVANAHTGGPLPQVGGG